MIAASPPSADDLAANLELLARRRSEIDSVLASVVPAGSRVALVNFPNHRNVGDTLLWLGAKRSLYRIGVDVAYECAWDTFSLRAMRARIGDGAILLNGGGNLGDAYRGQQGMREQVLQRCLDNPVVQLPQSTWFRDQANAVAMGERVAAHGGVTLLLRDRASLTFARTHLRAARTELCHDVALANPPMERRPARSPITFLTRDDAERLHDRPDHLLDGIEVHDWANTAEGSPGDGWSAADAKLLDLNTALRRTMARSDRVGAVARVLGWRPLAATFAPLARAWVERGVAMASTGQVVVTDRAHGHLLALLLGIHSVVLDTTNAKVSGIVDASTADSPLTHVAADLPEALEIARRLASGGAS